MDANERFMANPIDFLVNNSIINYIPASHLWGKLDEADTTKRVAAQNLIALDDGDGKIRFDLAKIGDNKYVWRRLLNLKQYMKQTLNIGFLPAWPDQPIEGNYFPYNSGVVADISDMGQIEIDSSELPVFSFTGVMNGCAFVVTDTHPRVANKYMLYHYQSPDSNTLYSPTGTRSFPNTMRCYVPVADYLPAKWSARYTIGAMPTTIIFLWRNPRTGDLRVVAQTIAVKPGILSVPNYGSRLVQSWLVQSNAEVGAAIKPYTSLDRQVHLSPISLT